VSGQALASYCVCEHGIHTGLVTQDNGMSSVNLDYSVHLAGSGIDLPTAGCAYQRARWRRATTVELRSRHCRGISGVLYGTVWRNRIRLTAVRCSTRTCSRETGVSRRCDTDDECFMTAQTIHEIVQRGLKLMLSAEVGGCERTRVSLSLKCIARPLARLLASPSRPRSRDPVVVTPCHGESAKVIVLFLLIKVL
jgi:hypothetical protein